MKPGLSIGDTHQFELTVTEDMNAQFPDGVVHQLYSTASMIQHMEWSSRQHILPYLEKDEEGVGCQVDIKHLAPTSIGQKVRIQSTVTGITPKKIITAVVAWRLDTPPVKIGEGRFTQALIDKPTK